MKRALHSELVKLRSVPSGWAPPLLAAALAAMAALAALQAAGTAGNPALTAADLPKFAGAASPMSTTIALIAGVLFATAEWRYGGIVDTLLRTPRRAPVVVAKLTATALAGAVVGLAAALASSLSGFAGLAARDVDPSLASAALWNGVLGGTLAGAGYAMIGAGLGVLLRNQAAALVAALIWRTGLEGALAVVLKMRAIVDWLPAATGATLANAGHGPAGHGPTELSMVVAGLVFAAYVVALGAAAALRTVRSDAV